MDKYRFQFRDNGTIVLMDPWDVPEMVRNSHDWICLDDVSRIMLGEAADVVLPNIPERKTLTLKTKNADRENVA